MSYLALLAWPFPFYFSHPLNEDSFLMFSNTISFRASDSRKEAVSVAGVKRRQGKEQKEGHRQTIQHQTSRHRAQKFTAEVAQKCHG